MFYPSKEEFIRGCQEFENNEKRDAMYKVATFLISHHWGDPENMANALGVLLLTWNQAFYRYGTLDFDYLEKAIIHKLPALNLFRARQISSLSHTDEKEINSLFIEFLDALRIKTKQGKIRRSPVSVAKTLHLLAPNFFPIWDDKIALAYQCQYYTEPSTKYYKFCLISQEFAKQVKNYITPSEKTLLKRIDEYNYSKYTKHWIE